mgnify:CR=1 FL=1
MNTTRREFLATVAGAAASATTLAAQAVREIKSPFNGPIGLQMWSLRESLPKDLAGTLAKIRAMGFRDVEGAGLWGTTVEKMRAALDAAGLRCTSAHMQLDRLDKDVAGALTEAKAMGASMVVCPWIQEKVTRDDIMKAADVFNKAAKAAHDRGMRFGYHCHGYEFIPSSDGTLFDTLMKNTDPKMVEVQVDVFHAFHGGADPAKLITQLGSRVTSLHLKDLKKGAPVKAGTALGTPDVDVPVGTGQVDWPAVLRAAKAAGPQRYFVEDESADPLGHIPQSVKYLEGIKI